MKRAGAASRRGRSRGPWAAATLCVSVVLLATVARSQSSGTEPTEPIAIETVSGDVFVAHADSMIQPVVAQFLIDGLAEADRTGAGLFVIELNTLGGGLGATQEIYTAMLQAKTPVVVYVAPQGAKAASAGFFILMAADVAAMAPGTNTGAAHPVGPKGEDIPGTMGEKVEQDTAASIRSLAARNGRDQELAESAVLESRAFSAEEALELGLIDVVAKDRADLLTQLDGYELHAADTSPRRLAIGPAPQLHELEMTSLQKIRSLLHVPDVVFALLSLGSLGILLEIYNPGALIPGVVGAICLILAGYGLSVLPVSYAGVALIGLAIALLALELKVPSFGVLTTGSVVSLILGGILLFDSPDPALRVSRQAIVAVTVITLAIGLGLATLAARAYRQRVSTGQEGLLQERGTARSSLDPRGKVTVRGEIWNAVAEQPVAQGEAIEVVGVDGMTLRVRPLLGSAAESRDRR